jgi:hypothetical protein
MLKRNLSNVFLRTLVQEIFLYVPKTTFNLIINHLN